MTDVRRVQSSQLRTAGECDSTYNNIGAGRGVEVLLTTTVCRCRVSLTSTSGRLLKAIPVLLFFCWNVIANAEAIHGRIIDSQAAPVAHAHLQLLNSAGTQIAETTSNAQGSFTLQSIDPGVYQLTAKAPSFLAVVADVSD